MKLKKMLLYVSVVLVIIVAVVSIMPTISNALFFKTLSKQSAPSEIISEPEYCRLCTHVPTNPPVAVNLNNGFTRDMRLFQPHDRICNAITEENHYGFMSMSGGEIQCWSFPDDRYADITIQKDKVYEYSPECAKQFFCDRCLDAIEQLNPTCNYVFVDAYDQNNLVLYNLEDVKDGIDIRHYHLIFEDTSNNSISIKMTSTYYEGGKALDY